jgi:hypothetical protein
MGEILKMLFEWNPGLMTAIVVGSILVVITLVYKSIFRDPPRFPQARYPGDQQAIQSAFHKVALKEHEEWGKGLGRSIFLNRPGGAGIIALIVILIAFCVVVIGGFGYILPNSVNPLLVQSGETCTGFRNEAIVYLPEGVEKIPGDICNGVVVPDVTPTVLVLTENTVPVFNPEPTMTQIILPTPTVEVFMTPSIELRTVWGFSDHTWNEKTLDGFTKVEESKNCNFSDPSFEVPANASDAIILFEGSASYLTSDDIVNVQGSVIWELVNNSVVATVKSCGPAFTKFSLWVK